MGRINLDDLVGSRFKNLELLEIRLKAMGASSPRVFKSESEKMESTDFILDGTFNNEKDFSLYYLLDNDQNFYITETVSWV